MDWKVLYSSQGGNALNVGELRTALMGVHDAAVLILNPQTGAEEMCIAPDGSHVMIS